MNDIKLTMLGNAGAGKSALVVRFLTKRYIGEYASTSESIYTKQMTIEGRQTKLRISDPCAQVTDELQKADGFLVVYDISHRASFVFARTLICRLRETSAQMCKRDAETVVFLIGNKQDLSHMREVTWEEGQKVALENRCQFYEVSAAEHCQEVAAMFTTIIRNIALNIKIRERRRPSGSRSMAKLINNVFGKRRKSV
ncbi:ras-related and estrogen-regulated growth inhibitor-like protein [Spea bombifrons]|uniref:ras-related and estrogen-regulated growth inhibitor-like protein n=1 Tax=Spea bombifrons TaxID=233779 RepID=UPI00234B2D85|nr:ras-related and estrogen-regulated growth inhibitor-like protein [Spea bombifrons]